MDVLQEKQSLFTNYCQNGELELAQALFETNPEYFCFDDALLYSTQHNTHNITRWLVQVMKNRWTPERVRERQNLFKSHCKNGDLELAQALFKTNLHLFDTDDVVLTSIANGSRNVTKWLLHVEQEWRNKRQQELEMRPRQEQFSNHCANGELELAKEFLELNPNIRVSWLGDDALRNALRNSHKEVAIWLLTCKSQTNYYYYFEQEFNLACEYGQLEIAQWIFQKYPNIDIFTNDNHGFTWACIYGHKNVIEWLLTLNPNQYIHGKHHEFALRRACQHDDVCHALWILCFEPDTNFTVVDDEKMQEKIFVLLLLYCFYHKNINLFML